MRIIVRPLANPRLAGHFEPRHETGHGVGIAVAPAAQRKYRTLDGSEVLAHRSVLPIGIASLMLDPGLHPKAAVTQSGEPHLAPALTDDRRIWRAAVVGEHDRRPAQIVGQKAAAHVMDVVGVAVIRRAGRNNRL